jgi:hypothetical protein
MKSALNNTFSHAISALPDVPDLLQALVDKDQLLAEKDHLIDTQSEQITRLQKQIEILEEYLRLAKIQRFGRSSEKLPFQGQLFDEAELEVSLDEYADALDDETVPQPKKRKPPREGFSDKLPRVRVEWLLSDEEKAGASKTFFVKVKEELDIIPAKAQVIEYWQEKRDDGAGHHLQSQPTQSQQ